MSNENAAMRKHPLVLAACTALLTFLPAMVFAADAGAGSATDKIAPNFATTIWAIASFVLVLIVIVTKLFPPITKALDQRAADIRDSLDAAEKARADAEKMMREHEDNLEKARQEARAIIDEGKADAEKLRAKILADAKSEADDITDRAKREIEQAKRSAVDDLQRQAVSLSLDLAGQLIGKSIDENEHQSLIQERVQRFQ